MRTLLARAFKALFGSELNFHIRLFHVLGLTGTCVGLLGGTASILNGEPWMSALANYSSSVIAIVLIYLGLKTGHYQRIYAVVIVLVFFIIFPVIYMTGGAYTGAMPYFFIFAIIFTISLLNGAPAIFFALSELLLYSVLFFLSKLYPQYFVFHTDPTVIFYDTLLGFVAVSISLGATLYIHFRLYAQQEKKLEAQNAALNKLNDVKTEFLANVSHELKTPLTVISTQAQLSANHLEQVDLPDESSRMRLITSETERMSLMVSQLLEVTRIEEGHMTCTLVPEQLCEVIETALTTYYPALQKNNNVLHFHRLNDLPPVLLDRMRIEQVLVNLISNAVRYTKDGEITIRITLRGAQEVQVSVTDTGDGMSEELLARLFQRFTQKKSRTEKDTGTGLGLYICKHIIQAHHGTIWAESKLGEGTSISFALPLQTPFA